MRIKLFFMFLVLGLSCNYHAFAQDKINTELELYGKKNAAPVLFVHYDKNIYTNNETIWFTAYLLNNPQTDTVPSILSVILIRNIDNALVLQDKFALVNGVSFGSITLPNVLSTGDYRVVAYTNNILNGKPVSDFVQDITIKTMTPQPVNVSVKSMEDPTAGREKILISATTSRNNLLPRPAIISYSYGNFKGTAKTDKVGQLLLDVPVQPDNIDPRLIAKVNYEQDSAFVSMDIKAKPRKATVNFYPEGGNLVNEIPGTVAYEVKDQYNTPLQLSAFLYKDDTVIDTLQTTAYGIGKFNLVPEQGSSYYVKLVHKDLIDSSYVLPKAINNSVTIALSAAVASDSLKVLLTTTKPQTVYIRLHNFKQTLAAAPIKVVTSHEVIIPLTSAPKGLATILITDSLGRPIAERMCYLKFDGSEKMQINTEKDSYNKRQKVNLKIKLADTTAYGLVSIACVQENRLDTKKSKDIQRYIYLENEMAGLPVNPSGNKLTDTAYLENVLLVKGWRRYVWKDVLKIIPKDTLQQASSLQIKGIVLKNKKPLKESVTILALSGTLFNTISTDRDGTFVPPVEKMLAEPGKRVVMSVQNKNKYFYTVSLNDPFVDLNNHLAKDYPSADTETSNDLRNNTNFVIRKEENSLDIKEVEIEGSKDSNIHGEEVDDFVPGFNKCMDFVCVNGILNCYNHNAYSKGSTQPVVGKHYLEWVGRTVQPVLYRGCDLTTSTFTYNTVAGISVSKEFYAGDYTDPNEPAFFSTLFWKPASLIDCNKEMDLSFYTGDIPGRFRIVVQGMTETEVISGQKTIEVLP